MNLPIDSYKGVIVPMVTPLTREGRISEIFAIKLIENLLNNDTIPFILGTTGESVSIPRKEKESLIEILISTKRSGIPAITGLLGLPVDETIAMANKYLKLGIDAVVLTLPSFYELSDLQMYNYYKQLAEKIEGNIILYNIPKTVHQSIPIEVIDKLSYFENIIGIKDSELNRERIINSLNLWKDRTDFYHFTGTNSLMQLGMELGSKGLVPSSANLIPEIYIELYKKCSDKNFEEADALFQKTVAWGEIYQKGKSLSESLAALKYLLSGINFCSPYMMSPLTEPNDEEKEQLSKELKKQLASIC
jgi:dihydrodipicolinate synthase/N-acetylneuraminate lyase